MNLAVIWTSRYGSEALIIIPLMFLYILSYYICSYMEYLDYFHTIYHTNFKAAGGIKVEVHIFIISFHKIFIAAVPRMYKSKLFFFGAFPWWRVLEPTNKKKSGLKFKNIFFIILDAFACCHTYFRVSTYSDCIFYAFGRPYSVFLMNE